MPSAETSTTALTVKELFPNRLHRSLFHLGTIRLAARSLLEAADNAEALRDVMWAADEADLEQINAYADGYVSRRRDEIFNERQLARWQTRCEAIVDRAIGSVATQRQALRFLEDTQS